MTTRTTKRNELAEEITNRFNRISQRNSDESSCDETVAIAPIKPFHASAWSTRVSAWVDRFHDRFRFDTRSRGVLSIVMLAVAAVAVVAAWCTWPSTHEAPQTVAVAETSDTTALPDQSIFVSVVGTVVEPGLVEVPVGSRVADAIDAAGGLLPEQDSAGYLNLARKVSDGELIIVEGDSVSADPSDSDVPGDGTGGAPSSTTKVSPGQNSLINLNTATTQELDALPGVGPVTASRIVEYRESNGGFDTVDQLEEVNGIGPSMMAKMRDMVTV